MLLSVNLPIIASMVIYDASISLANSLTAWLGSSYVCGSMYDLDVVEPTCVNRGVVTVKRTWHIVNNELKQFKLVVNEKKKKNEGGKVKNY